MKKPGMPDISGLTGKLKGINPRTAGMVILALLVVGACMYYSGTNPNANPPEAPGAQGVTETNVPAAERGWKYVTETEDDTWDVDEDALVNLMDEIGFPQSATLIVRLSPTQPDNCVRESNSVYKAYVNVDKAPEHDLDQVIAWCAQWASLRIEAENQGLYSSIPEEELYAKKVQVFAAAPTFASHYQVVFQKSQQ